ncbi:MAG: hypothetical protein HY878_04520 [Deltaproteobacteria bacterium]|nr:hypothetical protein [Deltaproteobacteria bacterium]
MVVKCEMCGADVPKKNAIVRYEDDEAHYFCSIECVREWEGGE